MKRSLRPWVAFLVHAACVGLARSARSARTAKAASILAALRSKSNAPPHAEETRLAVGGSSHEPATETPNGGEYLKMEAKAKEDFVRRCTLVMSTEDQRLIPLRQVDALCATTDRVEECTKDITSRFKGAQGVGVFPVCLAAYGWFQDQYGMLCPNQCEKAQCRPACYWLDAKKKFEARNASLEVEMQQLLLHEQEVVELRQQLEQRARRVQDLQKTALDASHEAATANKSLPQLEAELLAAQAEEARALQATTPGATKLRELRDQVSSASRLAADRTHERARLMMEAQIGLKHMQVLQRQVHQTDEGIVSGQLEVDRAEKKVRELKNDVSLLQPKVDDWRRRLDKAQAEVTRSEDALRRVEAELESVPDRQDKQPLEDQAKSRRRALTAAQESVEDIQPSLNEALRALQNKKDELAEVETQKSKQQDALSVALQKKATLYDRIRQEQLRAKSYSSQAESMQRSIVQAQKMVAQRQQAVKDAQVSIGPAYAVVLKKQERTKAAQKALAHARQSALLGSFSQREEALRAEQEAQDGIHLQERMQQLERETKEARADLEVRIAAEHTASQELQQKRPAVVQQHGLGLLELLKY